MGQKKYPMCYFYYFIIFKYKAKQLLIFQSSKTPQTFAKNN